MTPLEQARQIAADRHYVPGSMPYRGIISGQWDDAPIVREALTELEGGDGDD